MVAVDARLRIALGLSASELRRDETGIERVEPLPQADPGQLGVASGSRMDGSTLLLEPELASRYAAEILVVATRTARFSCCHLGAELQLWFDGVRWPGTSSDHLWHIAHWFPALQSVLEQDPAAVSAFVWDESGPALARAGSRLTLSDPRAPTVELDLAAFTRVLLREGRRFERYLAALRLETLAYAAPHELEALAPLGGDKPIAAAIDDPRLVRAVVWHELRQIPDLGPTLDAIARLSRASAPPEAKA